MPRGMTNTRETRLFMHLSNRLENLAAQLAQDLDEREGDPLCLRTVVVSSAETARWLSMELATRRGLAMGLRYPFLRSVVDELTTSMLGNGHVCSTRFHRDALTWWLYDHLPNFLSDERFGLVSNYLREGSMSRRYELARRIASLFDQYQIYRPQMLRSWDVERNSGDWQGDLWRAIRQDLRDEKSFVDLHAAIMALDDSHLSARALPKRISIFGLNTLPPAFLDVLEKAACQCRVDFYVLTPTPEYWSDLSTEKQRLRTRGPEREKEGNPLANSLGKLGRDLLDQLLARDAQQHSEIFESSPDGNLLERVQTDFLYLTDRTQGGPREIIGAADDSIEVNSCHSPMREIEVLHDRLLNLFQTDRSLRARDVIVMAPDIDLYAPYVRAVFGTPESDELRIPYSLADQSSRSRYDIIDAFMRVLEVGISPFEATRVVALLEMETIRQRFDLDKTDIERIRRWISDVGIVRGIDGEHRSRLGLGGDENFSFARGEKTLVFGYAMNGRGARLFDDIQPLADLEGDHLQTLGRWLNAMDLLRDVAKQLHKSLTRRQWAERLRHLLGQIFGDVTNSAEQLRSLQDAITDLARSDPMNRHEPIPVEIVLESLEYRLRDTAISGGFMDGRVTFCSLKPMRAIPAKVICLLGLSEGNFPRQGARLAFDLIASDPQRGDRSPRDDDRYLFLEALLSARRHLLVSHVGQSQRDPVNAPPASVVNELTDYLTRGFDLDPETKSRLGIAHKLQAFSRHYFVPGPLQSFSRDNAAAARCLATGVTRPWSLFVSPLPPPTSDWQNLTPDRLVAFFSHPARFLAEQRLGIRMPREAAELRDHEPVELDSLESYQLQQTLVESLLHGDDAALFDAARARGKLPAGAFGILAEAEISQSVANFVQVVRQQIQDQPATPVDINWQQDEWRITGLIEGLHGDQLCRFRCARLKAKDVICVWIEHLLLNLVRPGTRSCVIARDGALLRFSPPDSVTTTEEIVRSLLELYWQGLITPLRFFPETSRSFAHAQLRKFKPATRQAAAKAAQRVWLGNEYSPHSAESKDPWNVLLLGDVSTIDHELEDIALRFFTPLYAHMTEDES